MAFSHLKETWNGADFFGGQHCFTLLSTSFGKSSVKHSGALQLGTGRWHVANVAPHANMKPEVLTNPIQSRLTQSPFKVSPLFYKCPQWALNKVNMWKESRGFINCSIWCVRLLKIITDKELYKGLKGFTSYNVTCWLSRVIEIRFLCFRGLSFIQRCSSHMLYKHISVYFPPTLGQWQVNRLIFCLLSTMAGRSIRPEHGNSFSMFHVLFLSAISIILSHSAFLVDFSRPQPVFICHQIVLVVINFLPIVSWIVAVTVINAIKTGNRGSLWEIIAKNLLQYKCKSLFV